MEKEGKCFFHRKEGKEECKQCQLIAIANLHQGERQKMTATIRGKAIKTHGEGLLPWLIFASEIHCTEFHSCWRPASWRLSLTSYNAAWIVRSLRYALKCFKLNPRNCFFDSRLPVGTTSPLVRVIESWVPRSQQQQCRERGTANWSLFRPGCLIICSMFIDVCFIFFPSFCIEWIWASESGVDSTHFCTSRRKQIYSPYLHQQKIRARICLMLQVTRKSITQFRDELAQVGSEHVRASSGSFTACHHPNVSSNSPSKQYHTLQRSSNIFDKLDLPFPEPCMPCFVYQIKSQTIHCRLYLTLVS